MGRALVLIALGLAGCDGSRPGDEGRAAAPAPLRVAAASDLQNVLPTLVERFTRASKVEVSLTFGASGQLAEQIKNGAPFAVFLPAHHAFVQPLAAPAL